MDGIVLFTLLTYCCLCCIGISFLLAILLLIYYITRKNKIEASNEYFSDFISKFWYRTFLITPKGVFVVLLSFSALLLSYSSIELSVISTITFFFLTIFIIIYSYSQIINFYLLIKQTILKNKLIESYLTFHTIQAGDKVEKSVRLKIPFPIGFIVKLTLFIPPILGSEIRSMSHKKVNDFIEFKAVLPKSKRGEYKIGPVSVEYEDILGFTKIQIIDRAKNNLLILPKVERIKKLDWKIASTKLSDEITVKRIINSEDFYNIRPYVRGDDVKKIHWKLTAKTDNLMMRLPEITSVSLGKFFIILDNLIPGDSESGKLYANYEGSEDLLDKMIEVSATITDFSMRNNSEVEFLYFDTPNKLKKLTFKTKRREEWLAKLATIKWQPKTKANESTFNFIDNINTSGVFFITSENSLLRMNNFISQFKNYKILNFFYFNAPTFIKVDKKSKLNRLQRIFLTEPYLDQTATLDSLITPSKKKFIKIKKDDFEKIKTNAQKVIRFIKQKVGDFKKFEKNSNLSNILENQ